MPFKTDYSDDDCDADTENDSRDDSCDDSDNFDDIDDLSKTCLYFKSSTKAAASLGL